LSVKSDYFVSLKKETNKIKLVYKIFDEFNIFHIFHTESKKLTQFEKNFNSICRAIPLVNNKTSCPLPTIPI
jgi:hypothetical protein